MRVIAISQARLNSTRLPNKVLQKIGNTTVLGLHINRILKCRNIDRLVVATTLNPQDEKIISVCENFKVSTFRGSEEDVLDRYYKAALPYKPDFVVRVTSDNPLIDPWLIDSIVEKSIRMDLDYISNSLNHTYPNGLEVEVIKFASLKRAWKESTLPSEREHVTPYIWKNCSFFEKSKFSSANISSSLCYKQVRMTVDVEADLQVIQNLVRDLGIDKGWLAYARHYAANKHIYELNSHITRNLGYERSIEEENMQFNLITRAGNCSF